MKSLSAYAASTSRRIVAAAVAAAVFNGHTIAAEVLEEVVVTAQKRQEALNDVPISIAAVSGTQLSEAGLRTVNQLPMMVPGMRIDQQGTFSQPTIRGVGSSTAGAGFTSNVAVYIDGFYIPNQLHTDMQLLNLRNVQVLKGPQGTLFGRNATGGAILLETEDASFDPTLKIEGTAAEYGRYDLNFYGSTGLTDTIAADIAVLYQEGDGYVDNIVKGGDDYAAFDRTTVRASLLYKNDSGFKGELAYSYYDADDPTSNAKGVLDGLTFGVYFPTATIPTDDFDVASTAPVEFTAESDGVYLTLEQEFENMTLKSLTMYRDEQSKSRLDLDSTDAVIFAVEYTPKSEVFTQEFNLSGNTGRLDWIVGAFYMDYEEQFYNLQATEFPLVVYTEIGTDITAWAVFADATYQIMDRLYLTAGVRYSDEEAESYVHNHIAFGDIPDWDSSWDEVTPRAVLRYEMTDNSSVYVSYTEGFKAGLLLPSTPDTTPVDQEQIEAWEVGYKIQCDTWRLSLAAYTYDYTDMQVASYNGVAALVRNAASSSIDGADLEFTTLIGSNFEITAGVAYTDAEYDDFPGSQPRDLNPASPTFLKILPGDAGGNTMIRSPEWTGTVSASYDQSLGGMGSLRYNATWYYTDDVNFDPNEQFVQESYDVLNVRVTWRDSSEHYSVAAWMNNALDETYYNQVLPGDYAIQPGWGEPRVFGVTLGYTY